ncbi:hypothetical protein FRC09_003939 [Ceratobasidium sp. 395]|nr:hypothetical protein FRC09_003939 [Ceratobasidium sp. 395]
MPKSYRAPFLEILRSAASRLPETIPSASFDDQIYQHFHDIAIRSDKRTFQPFERAYTACFQPDPEGQLTRPDNIMRGEHGIDLVISYIEANAKNPKMNGDELRRTAFMVQQLVDLVHQRIRDAPKLTRVNSGGRQGNHEDETATGSTGHRVTKGRVSKLHDADYVPGEDPESSGEELDVEAEKESGILGFGRPVDKERQAEPKDEESGSGRVEAVDSNDDEDSNNVPAMPKPGRPADKGNWAMAQFDNPPTAGVRSNGEPIWMFKCKWCRRSRNVPRTAGCTVWDKERAELKAFRRSNFISHAENCDELPPDHKYNAAHEASADDTKIVNKSALPFSQRDFSAALTKAVVRDNYSMTFGEGEGMVQFFNSILPGIRLPSHQTLQRYLYRLFDILGEKVKSDLKAVERHALSTDAWTSKNSVYSLAAIILFFIDDDWRLRELVLDVVDLEAEHSGDHLGRLLYKSLKAKETAQRTIACVTDAASNNATMNKTLAKEIQNHEHTHVHGEGMAFTDILSNTGTVEPGDYYSDVKGSDMADLSRELEDPELDAGSDSDDDDALSRLGLAPDTAREDAEDNEQTKKNTIKKNPWLETLNVVQKVHEIVVYVTASPKRRKEFHQTIRSTCSKDKSHLFVIQSMRMRWGSAYLEEKRALELRPAFIHFVANLDSDRPRNLSLKRARRLQERWAIRSEEWDLLAMLINVLHPFYTATEAMSRKDVATLADVFPTFVLLERRLVNQLAELKHIPKGPENVSARALESGLEAGLKKLRKYQSLAQQTLNPRLRLRYLERWPDVHARAKTIFEYLFETYRAASSDIAESLMNTSKSPLKSHPKFAGSWNDEIYADVPSFVEHFDQELYDYFSGSHPCPPETDTLAWWKAFSVRFPTVAKMARDFLCIPAASVSVERLFSQCKLTMTDIRSSMLFETARRRICCQHWMKSGLDMDIVRKALGAEE